MMTSRIRVATVITRMTAGAGGVALRGALALDPSAYEVTIIAGGAGFDGENSYRGDADVLRGRDAIRHAPAGDLLAAAEAAGLQVIRVPGLVPEIAPRRDAAALRTLTMLAGDGHYDVVHTHSAKAGALGRVAAYRAGVPRIVHTYHGFPFHDFQAPWRRRAYINIERWLGRRTNAVLAVGAAVAAETARLRLVSPEQIRTIAPAVETIGYPSGTAARGLARRRIGIPPGVRLVGTVGRVDYQKAPDQWVEAFAQVAGQDVWGIWIGDGPLREKMLARVRRLGLSRWFCFLGHRDDATALLPAMDVFALASRYEGVPCVLAEAMQAHVPVVATAVNGVPDLVIPGVTGYLVPPNAPPLLARASAYLLDNPVEARRIAAAAFASLGDRFSPRTLGVALDLAYQTSRPRPTTRARPAPPPRRSVQWTSP
jgi:glycosyltransferase involved in cell wall biosynthesis